jgi:hypothetical protein
MASTTFIDNQTTIFADWLNDANNAVYNGVFVSPTITATSMVCTGTASGAGFTNLVNNTFASPAAIGSATPNTGAFTTLSATAVTATSITGLTTPLSRAQGGTGLSAAGISEYVLTSDGTNWTSAINPTIGVGQTWQSFTVGTTRVSGTTYTNTTSKPIAVAIVAQINAALSMTIGGVALVGNAVNSGTNRSWTLYIVPPNQTYVTSGTILDWFELR